MNEDLLRARQLLEDGSYTCVLCHGQHIYTSTERGVRPLLELPPNDYRGFSAADKVIGKATAFLYVNLGVRAVYAPVISESALRVLKRSGIEVHYGVSVSAIFNRSRTGFCPMETAVRDIEDLNEALQAIRETYARMNNK